VRMSSGFAAALVTGLVSAALMPMLDIMIGGAMSQSSFYFSMMLPGTAIATGAFMHELTKEGMPTKWFLPGLLLAVSVTSIYLAPVLWSFADRIFPLSSTFAMIVAGCVLVLGVLLVPDQMRALKTSVLASLVVLVVFAGIINKDTRVVFRAPGQIDSRHFAEAAVFVRNRLAPFLYSQKRMFFWYEKGSFQRSDGKPDIQKRPLRFKGETIELDFFDNLVALHLWDRSIFRNDLTAGSILTRKDLLVLRKGVLLVILGNTPEKLDEALTLLQKAGVKIRSVNAKLPFDPGYVLYVDPSFSLFVSVFEVAEVPVSTSPGANEFQAE
jgi:hypothetical protein